jgi:4-aminobutyrate aminotransferase / (S)-3-amino-2-methylpropionate transaminase / 5-aminovalerate transaminase
MIKKFPDNFKNERKNIIPVSSDYIKKINESYFKPKTKSLLKKWVEFCSFGEPAFGLFPCPPIIEKGNGCIVFDTDGKEYLDLLSGFSVHSLGHCNKEISETITFQANKLTQYFGTINEPWIRLAENICNATPGKFKKRALFANSGSEAIEAIMKLVRWYTGKPFILTQYGDYHGKTAGAQALTPKGGWTYNYPILPADSGIGYFPYAYCYRCSFDKSYPECDIYCTKYLERLLTSQEAPYVDPGSGISRIAAIVIEPMQSSAGYIIPPKEYLLNIQEICSKFDILLALDEIQCGMARTGKMWACEHSKVVPDIIALGKAFGGGLPISAVVTRSEIIEEWGPGAFYGTFSSNPLCSATALKTLEIIERDNIAAKAAETGKYFLNGLKEITKRHAIVGSLDGLGLYIGMELVKDKKSKAPAIEETSFMNSEFLKNGLICERTGYFHNRFNLIPALIITKEQINKAVEIIDKVLIKTEKEFGYKKI